MTFSLTKLWISDHKTISYIPDIYMHMVHTPNTKLIGHCRSYKIKLMTIKLHHLVISIDSILITINSYISARMLI